MTVSKPPSSRCRQQQLHALTCCGRLLQLRCVWAAEPSVYDTKRFVVPHTGKLDTAGAACSAQGLQPCSAKTFMQN